MNRTERAERVRQDLAKLKAVFPDCNAAVYSICSRPSRTGATWTKQAREIMGRRDAHKLTHSLRVRVTEERYNEVKAIIEATGQFPTVNAWLDWWVWVYVKSYRKALDNARAASGLMSKVNVKTIESPFETEKDPLATWHVENGSKGEAVSTGFASENNTNFEGGQTND